MNEKYKWFGEFPDKKSYPNRIHVWAKKIDDTNCIIADTFDVNNSGFTQLRINKNNDVALIRFNSAKSKAPYPYTKAKILWDSRKYFKNI